MFLWNLGTKVNVFEERSQEKNVLVTLDVEQKSYGEI